ncbi:hypothetical protein ABZ545_19765 [Streptomyces abikoensis]|uniref:hypothetical protein n=1 Tax=Streptomyces abikoensis TaxID=97398 RepID=UPI0033E5A3FA
MDAVRSALCGALTAAALVAGAGAADANDGPVTMSGTMELTPVTSRPGAEVQLRVSGCAGDRGTATSEAFVSDAKLAKDSAGLFAEATVREAVRPGTYPVRVSCDGSEHTAEGRLTVVTDGSDARRGEYPDADHPAAGSLADHDDHAALTGRDHRLGHSSPVAPVPAGGGGSTTHAAAVEPPDTAGLVLAGTTAAIAGALIWHRRRTTAARR